MIASGVAPAQSGPRRAGGEDDSRPNTCLSSQPLQLTGTYAYTSDCSFQMNFDVVGFRFTAMIAGGGREVQFLETDPRTTFVVKTKKQQS